MLCIQQPDLFLPLLLGSQHSLTFYPPPLCHRCLLHFFWSHFPVPVLTSSLFLLCFPSLPSVHPCDSTSPPKLKGIHFTGLKKSNYCMCLFMAFTISPLSVLLHPYWHRHTAYLRTLQCVHVGGSNKQSALSRKLCGNTLWNYNRRCTSRSKWGGIWKGEAVKIEDLRRRSQSAYRGRASKWSKQRLIPENSLPRWSEVSHYFWKESQAPWKRTTQHKTLIRAGAADQISDKSFTHIYKQQQTRTDVRVYIMSSYCEMK